jgi:hypothetical protein
MSLIAGSAICSILSPIPGSSWWPGIGVRHNKGARTAGVDGETARYIEAVRGVEGVLTELREDLKARAFRPLPVRRRAIPKAGGKVRYLGIATDDSYCPPAVACRDVRAWCGFARARAAFTGSLV